MASRRRNSVLIIGFALMTLVAAACSGSDDQTPTTETSSTSSSTTTSSTSTTLVDESSTTTATPDGSTTTTAPPTATQPTTTTAARPAEDVSTALTNAVRAWAAGDQSMGGRAAPGADIHANSDPDLDPGSMDSCELESNGSGYCEFLSTSADGGNALIWQLSYHQENGVILVDSLQFGGDAG